MTHLYKKPEFEIVEVRLTQDILTASQEVPIPTVTEDPGGDPDPDFDDMFN